MILQSLTTSLSRVLQSLRHLAQELNKPKAHWKQDQIVRKIERLAGGTLPSRVDSLSTGTTRRTLALAFAVRLRFCRLAAVARPAPGAHRAADQPHGLECMSSLSKHREVYNRALW